MQTDLIFDEKSNYSPKQRNMEVFRGAVQRRNRDETQRTTGILIAVRKSGSAL